MALLTDVHSIQEDFSNLIRRAKAQALAKFIVWLDMKVAEYKVNGCMCLDQHVTLKPQWLQEAGEDDDHLSDVVKSNLSQNRKRKPTCEMTSESETELDLTSSDVVLELSKSHPSKKKMSSNKTDEDPCLRLSVSNSNIQHTKSLKQHQAVVKKEVIDFDYTEQLNESSDVRISDHENHSSDHGHGQNSRIQKTSDSITPSNKKSNAQNCPSQHVSLSQSTFPSSSLHLHSVSAISHPVTKRYTAILPKTTNHQTISFLEQYKNQIASFPGSQQTKKRIMLPSCTVTSRTDSLHSVSERQLPSSSQSDTGDSASSADNSRIDQSEMPLIMKVESPDVEEDDNIQMNESHVSDMVDSKASKVKFMSHNSNIGKTLDTGGDELANMSGLGEEDSTFQDTHVPFPKLPGYRQTYTSDAHIAVNINGGKPYIFAKNNMDEQENMWQMQSMTGNTLFDKISTKCGRQYLKCPYCQYITKRTFNFRRHLLSHGVVFYQRQLMVDDYPNYNVDFPLPEQQFVGTMDSLCL